MELVNLEKFLFFKNCDITKITEENNEKFSVKEKVNMLFSLNAVYFFKELDNKNTDEKTELEEYLFFKMLHSDIYLIDFNETNFLTYKIKNLKTTVLIEIKETLGGQFNFKLFNNVAIILDGYKLILEQLNVDFTSYLNWLYDVIDCYIVNNEVILSDNFFNVEHEFLSNFMFYLNKLENFSIRLNFSDVRLILAFKDIFCSGSQNKSIFLTVNNDFNLTTNNFENLNNNNLKIEKLILLRKLKICDNSLDDVGFVNLIDIFGQAEFLINLEITDNFISGESLSLISKLFAKGCLKYIEKLNFSNNWIDSFKLDEFFKNTIENCERINCINLSKNFIDNEFLKAIDMYCRSLKEVTREIYIDLRENRFDGFVYRSKFFVWKSEEESDSKIIERFARVYSLKHFVENLSKMEHILFKIKFDQIKHYKEKDYDICNTENYNFKFGDKLRVGSNNLRLSAKTLKNFTKNNFIDNNSNNNNNNNNVNENIKSEIDLYKEAFELFYLMDHYFDPILNNNFTYNLSEQAKDQNYEALTNVNFNTILGLGLTNINKSNMNNSFYKEETLNNNNNNKSDKRNNYDKFSDMQKNLKSLNLANNLNVNTNFFFANSNSLNYSSNIGNLVLINNYYFNQKPKIVYKFFKKDLIDFNPNVSIEDLTKFCDVLKSLEMSGLNFSYLPLHKYISRVKIESLLAIKDKDIHTIKYLSQICTFLKISFNEKIEHEYNKLLFKSKIIHEALKGILNFEGREIATNKFFYNEVNNFLDIFLHEAESINLKNDLIFVAKYVQFVRNNKIRKNFYKIYETMLKNENLLSSEYAENLSDVDVFFKKYEDIVDFDMLHVDNLIKNKNLAFHPKRLDYLLIGEMNLKEVKFDLDLMIQSLTREENYGPRNIHDRIHFLFSKSKIKLNNISFGCNCRREFQISFTQAKRCFKDGSFSIQIFQ